MSSCRLEGESRFLAIGTLLHQRVTQSLAGIRFTRHTRIYGRIRKPIAQKAADNVLCEDDGIESVP